jgi:hypothetical protein
VTRKKPVITGTRRAWAILASIDRQYTTQQLADLAGIAYHTLYKSLQRWHVQGHVEVVIDPITRKALYPTLWYKVGGSEYPLTPGKESEKNQERVAK